MMRNPQTRILVASDWAPIRAFGPMMRSEPESVYGDLLPDLRDADLRIVNCECALTKAGKPVWKSGSVFKGEPAHAKALAAVPFEVACLANNHVLDYGVAGLRETLSVLRRHAVRTVGAGLTEEEAYRPLSLTVNGTKVHIVNVSEGEDLTASRGGPGVFGWDVARATSLISRCRKRGGIVIAIAHCGLEYVPYPPPYVATAFRAMVDAGAACVVGHHPHVPQGIEWRRGRPIIYSLGNFAFYQLTDLFWRRTGFCVRLHFAGDRLTDVERLPYRITDLGLRALDAKADAAFRHTMARLSRPLRTPALAERAWQTYVDSYGKDGFTAEVLGILEKMNTEPPKGAAMFRNRITTMQHRELWRDLLTRMMAGGRPRVSREARRTVDEWFTRTMSA
jgi:poly-gamma-glutamate capsule biosynthesis protein CapA/YwtB (metallophosphatase superfamily)